MRLNAHLRRRERDRERQHEGRDRRPEAFSVGDLEIRFGKYEVRMRGEVVALSSREIELLELARLRSGRRVHPRSDPRGALGKQRGCRPQLHHRHGA